MFIIYPLLSKESSPTVNLMGKCGMIKESDEGKGVDMEFLVIDFETTGLSAIRDRIIEVGYAIVKEDKIIEGGSQLVKPEKMITNPMITQITGIDNLMLQDAPDLYAYMKDFYALIEGRLLVAHNAPFDMGFLNNTLYRMGLPTYHGYLCTADLFRAYKKAQGIMTDGASLAKVVAHFGLENKRAHRAGADAEVTAKALIKMCQVIDFRDHMVGPSKRAKVFNVLDHATKKDQYMRLFDQNKPFDEICQVMKVKEATAAKYLLDWLLYADLKPYEATLKSWMPDQAILKEIISLKKQGKRTNEIFRHFGGSIDYFIVQLVGRLSHQLDH